MPLTERQTQILAAWRDLTRPRSPTVREVAARVGVSSTRVHQVLKRLRKLGLLDDHTPLPTSAGAVPDTAGDPVARLVSREYTGRLSGATVVADGEQYAAVRRTIEARLPLRGLSVANATKRCAEAVLSASVPLP